MFKLTTTSLIFHNSLSHKIDYTHFRKEDRKYFIKHFKTAITKALYNV